MIKLASVIKEMHTAGYVHLDIKPANIFIERIQLGSPIQFVLGDFGLAGRKSETDIEFVIGTCPSAQGTPHYMGPCRYHYYIVESSIMRFINYFGLRKAHVRQMK